MDDAELDEITARLDGPGLCAGHAFNGQSTIACECADEDVAMLIAEVRWLQEALKPFAHHVRAGDSLDDDRERTIRVTIGQVAKAARVLGRG